MLNLRIANISTETALLSVENDILMIMNKSRNYLGTTRSKCSIWYCSPYHPSEMTTRFAFGITGEELTWFNRFQHIY